MSIGAFAQRTRLSQKALRLYDAMGLLTPALVNDESGYRYYREDQIERARLIALLRQLEMPLDRLAVVIDLSGLEASRAIASYWAEVEADLRTKRRLVRYLNNYLEGRGETMYQIEIRATPQMKVASITGRVLAPDLPGFIGDSMGRIITHLHAANLEIAAPPFVAYHGQVDRDSDGPVEVCVPFEGSLEPAGDIAVRVEPGHQEAYTRISKAQVEFPGILEAFDAVGRHLKEVGKSPAGPPREVYFADWDSVGPDDPACDITYPFQD